jgi:hypothetical protein
MYYVREHIGVIPASAMSDSNPGNFKYTACTSTKKTEACTMYLHSEKQIAVSRGKKEIQVYVLYTLQIQEQEFYPQPYLDKCQEAAVRPHIASSEWSTLRSAHALSYVRYTNVTIRDVKEIFKNIIRKPRWLCFFFWPWWQHVSVPSLSVQRSTPIQCCWQPNICLRHIAF